MWFVELLQHTIVQHSDLVEIDDGLQLMSDGDDGMFGELLADDALDECVGDIIDADKW